MKKQKWIYFLSSLIFLNLGIIQAQENNLLLQNEKVKISLNPGPEDQGRFAIDTYDNQSLIFGHPIPWTSYTTLNIDDEIFVFGGPNRKIEKRAGKSVQFGEFMSQKTTESGIETRYAFKNILVTQYLTIVPNPNTKALDTVKISYTLLNKDNQPHRVGLRLMLDTKLGENDGAPLRMGTQEMETEIILSGDDIQDYWQAFDQLVSPKIIAQGTLRYPQEKLTPPDTLYFANWGTLADQPWEAQVKTGHSFIREGETETDTALALLWNPTSVAPLESKTLRTLYGLGSVSTQAGALSLGLTAPAEVFAQNQTPILIIGYISNQSETLAKDSVVTFKIPEGFSIIKGEPTFTLPTLRKGQTQQFILKLRPTATANGPKILEFSVNNTVLGTNQITRNVTIIPSPTLNSTLVLPQPIPSSQKWVDATLTIQNPTEYPIDNVQATLSTPNPLELPIFETKTKSISRISPHTTETVNWRLSIPNITPTAAFTLMATLKSAITPLQKLKVKSHFQLPKSQLRLQGDESALSTFDYTYVWLTLNNSTILSDLAFNLQYDPEALQLIRWSPELWLEESHQLPQFHFSFGHISAIDLVLNTPAQEKRVAKFHFKVLQTGKIPITLISNGESQTLILNVNPKEKIK